ncbi:nuclease-related domain-containing protein [Actinotalea ferrariae]|uniref:nuclease-related domain-containing protein n=1 Tax=Actinotalea ferrariae TaxID=1386098 RepID=UPI0021AB94C1|nr:nuclease-related domain-containing protein [Actinotalea ferrariae]
MTTTPDEAAALSKVMRLRYAGTCEACGAAIDAGTRATYIRVSKTVRCLQCPGDAAAPAEAAPSTAPVEPLETIAEPVPASEPEVVEAGTAGSSARREYERRSAKREARIREKHPRLGGLILAITDEPQSTTAWARGARGEELLAAGLDRLAGRGVHLLHDRRIPRTRANIDHVAVASSGVHVIDAKRYKGRPSLRVEGGLFRPRVEKLVVGSRECTRLVEGMHKQTGLVRAALDGAGYADVPVHGALCFVEADWPLFGGSFVIDGVAVLWPKKLGERLVAPGALTEHDVDAVHRALARAFPAA